MACDVSQVKSLVVSYLSKFIVFRVHAELQIVSAAVAFYNRLSVQNAHINETQFTSNK